MICHLASRIGAVTSRYLCQQYRPGETVFSTKVDGTSYFAVVECSQLPPERICEDRTVRRGAAVGLDRWFFFPAPEPAVAFVRAARMSLDRTARHHGAYNAARETRFCHRHDRDEVVLLVDVHGEDLDRAADEADHLARFVQGVKEHPQSSVWREPTG